MLVLVLIGGARIQSGVMVVYSVLVLYSWIWPLVLSHLQSYDQVYCCGESEPIPGILRYTSLLIGHWSLPEDLTGR